MRPFCTSGGFGRAMLRGTKLGWMMGLFYFIIGVFVGVCLLALLPLLLATFGIALAIVMAVTLPLLAAALIFFGIIAALPVVGYGIAIAALLIILWANERKRQHPDARG
jgi:hypothetical protein